jgi:transitional endoplasmic reticulum ATPase
MGEHSDSIMFNDYTKAAFEGFKSHFNNHRTSTELSMLEHLRETHADYHVTCTTPTRCDLHGFAKAELATMALDNTYLLDTTRVYKIPQTRLSGEPGILRNQIRFACWNLTWNSSAYIVYEIEYETESPFSPPKRLFFILSPRTTTTQEGTSSSTDELLLSVGAWSSALHDEIWVFDEGAWSKSRELYESVQSASWSDVILNPATKNSLITDITSFFSSRDLYKNLAVPWKRGLIFHGVPGNGKTISIKALINELGQREDPVPSLYVKNFDACQGEKYSIKEIFAQARGMAPCLLVFEDLDSLVTDETRTYFLNEVDGLESNDGSECFSFWVW